MRWLKQLRLHSILANQAYTQRLLALNARCCVCANVIRELRFREEDVLLDASIIFARNDFCAARMIGFGNSSVRTI